MDMDKLDELYDISKRIVMVEDGITELSSNMIAEASSISNELIAELKTLVLKEYDLVAKMSSIEMDDCLGALKNLVIKRFQTIDNNIAKKLTNIVDIERYLGGVSIKSETDISNLEIDTLLRICCVLKRQIDSLFGELIKVQNLLGPAIPENVQASIGDIILAMLYIEVLKRLKKKIYTLKPLARQDILFIQDIKLNLNIYQYLIFFENFAPEVISLCYDCDLDKIPTLDINKIKELKVCDALATNDFIMDMAEFIVSKLAKIQNVNIDSNIEIFSFLITITNFEVLISYMDKGMLKKIYGYCLEVSNSKNLACMSGVAKLVKKKLKEDNKS